MVRGTVKDIDAVAELLQLIDVPPQQVNVAVKLLNVAGGWSEESGGDVAGAFPGFDLAARGQAPATGPTMRFGSGGAQALVGGSRTQSLADNSVEASVTTINNTPCVIRAATLIPYVTANVTYNRAGQRQVDYAVDAVATGVELVVLPRITGQDTVTMLLRPSFIDAVGRALTPDGQALPITQETAVETQIRVRDGETVVIGGLPRHTETLQSLGLPVLPLRAESLADVESLVLVRPRILRSPPR
jgi:type II secretory pathway component GspD/PulD (secretin)